MKTQDTINKSFSSNRTMEISIWIIALLVVTILLVSSSASAMNLKFEDEAYIDDIPFNTEIVAYDLMMPAFTFNEEDNVDDIPFNTSTVAANSIYNEAIAVAYQFENENYVEDIPFSTDEVVVAYNFQMAFEQEFKLAEETEVDDIPFNTCMVASSMMHYNTHVIYACTK